MKKATEWRPIPGFSQYIISDQGELRRVNSKTSVRLIGGTQTSGHRTAAVITDTGERHRIGIHVLVMAAFVGPRPDGMFVCHNNGKSDDNRLENLRYDTSAGNRADTIRHGTHIYGSMSKVAKLTEKQVRQIRKKRATGRTCISLAREYNVCESTISKIVRFDTWTRA